NLAHHYAALFSVDEKEIQSENVASENGNTYTGEQYEFDFNEYFKIVVTAGAIPTNPRRSVITLAIFDSETNQKTFHVDISESATGGAAIAAEKRQGRTSLKQDEVKAELSLQDGHIHYSISNNAQEILRKPDIVSTETEGVGDVAEIFLRALRMNLLHEITEIQLHDERKVEVPDLRMFLPQFTSDSIFHLRARVLEFVQKGESLPQNVLPLLMKELALCLTIDPFITVQALRDAGISLLIPGLRHMNRWQWEKILKSQHFVVSPSRAGKAERTMDFIEKERKLYRSGDSSRRIPKPYNGLSYFIRALQEIDVLPKEGNEWAPFVRLWQQSQSTETGGSQAKERIRDKRRSSIASISLLGQRFTLIKNGVQLTPEDIDRLQRGLSPVASRESILNEQLQKAWDIIHLYSDGTNLAELFYRYSELEILHQRGLELSDEEQQEMKTIWNYIQNVAVLYNILEQFPSGLTPRELLLLHEKADINISKLKDFRSLFYTLKTLGVVEKHDQKRINMHGYLEDVSFYSLRMHASVYQLDDFVTSSEFLA
ncbi:MAG TPA: hypothetical protein VJ044_10145, partial [Candidatus Hodarchaeales archaeon]|nr:hypothetical protein [Candidatus Hodarchaeales archaeon]